MIELTLRQDPAGHWTSRDPILQQGEIGLESDTGLMKLGDGSNWSALQYINDTRINTQTGTSYTVKATDRGNVSDPTNTYPEQLEVLLETATGTAWNIGDPVNPQIAEIAACLYRIRSLAVSNANKVLDAWQNHNIVVCWGGTNDLAQEATVAAGTFTADATANTLTMTGHGLVDGLNVRVSSTTTLPAPLTAGTDYAVQAA